MHEPAAINLLSRAGFLRGAVPRDEDRQNLEAILKGISRALRSFNSNIADEPLPDRLAKLVERLSKGEEKPDLNRNGQKHSG